MRTIAMSTLTLLIFGPAGFAAGPVTTGPAADEVKKTDTAMSQAAMKNDVAVLEKHTADEYILTDPSGETSNKKACMDAFKAKLYKFESFKDTDVKAMVYGDTAVLTGHSEMKGSVGGVDISGPYRFTRTYVRRDGRWQCVAEQMTKVLKAP